MTSRLLPAAATAFMLLASASTRAEVQTCSLTLGNGTRAMLRIDDHDLAIHAIGVDLSQVAGGSVHECSLGARRGDGHSRWRQQGATTYVSLDDPATGPLEAVMQRYRGDLQLSFSVPGGDLASCGTISMPGTLIVTPKPNGRCIARLPRQPHTE